MFTKLQFREFADRQSDVTAEKKASLSEVGQVPDEYTPHLNTHHATGHPGCHLVEVAFSFLREASKKSCETE